MGVHAYHDALPGFSPNAVLHEGCEECESRAGIHGLGQLDWKNSQRVVERAIRWNREGLPDTNATEIKLFQAVWSMLLFLETNTTLDPLNEGLPWHDFERMERELFGGRA